jgi:hypothetical protein
MALATVLALHDICGKVIDSLWPNLLHADRAKLEFIKLQQSANLEHVAGELESTSAGTESEPV